MFYPLYCGFAYLLLLISYDSMKAILDHLTYQAQGGYTNNRYSRKERHPTIANTTVRPNVIKVIVVQFTMDPLNE